MSEILENELQEKTGVAKQTAEISGATLLGDSFWGAFIPTSRNVNPGTTYFYLSGFPAGTRYISAWMTERSGDAPHAGSAIYYTDSVQLYNNGTQCRIAFRLDWGSSLPSAAQVIYG
jgi:hypothetical protein